MSVLRRIRLYRHHFLAVLGYLGLAVVLTYPLIREFSQAIPGDGFDGWQNVWNIWWVKRALLEEQTHPYFTALVDYPMGVALFFHTLNIFNGLSFLPITLNWGNLAAYNTGVIFSFVAGGYGTYLLALQALQQKSGELSEDPRTRTHLRLASFAAGVIFAFSPYHMAHLLGHMQLISLEWLPFFALFALRQMTAAAAPSREANERTRCPKHLLRNALLSAIFLVLVVSCDWYYAFYMAIFAALLWLWTILHHRRQWLWPTLSLAITAIIFLLATSLLWIPMVREAAVNNYMVPPPGSTERLSADLTAFFTPSELHPWWGEWAAGWANRFTASTSERTVFAGFSVLILALLALIARRKLVAFWGIGAAVFTVLALGPVLHIGGQTQFGPVGPIPLPYALLHRAIPILKISRSVSRFDVVVMLCLAVLAAAGLWWLLNRLSGPRAKSAVSLLISAGAVVIIAVEFLAAPYPMSFPETHPFHYELAQGTDDFAIMDIPMDWDRPANLLFQTVHGKATVSGYTSRTNPDSPAWRTPVLQAFRYLGPDVNTPDAPAKLAPQVLNDLDVRYVIVHKMDLPPGEYRQQTLDLVDSVFAGWEVVVDDDWLKVLRVPDSDLPQHPYTVVGEGWGSREIVEKLPARQMMGQEASFHLHLAKAGSVSLDLTGRGRSASTVVEVEVNEKPLGSFEFAPQGNTISVQTGELPAGSSVVTLRCQPPECFVVNEIDVQPAAGN
jgi:hypothetical protein